MSSSAAGLIDALRDALADRPGTARELVRRLAARGIDAERRAINRALYGTPRMFRNDGDTPPTWYTIAATLGRPNQGARRSVHPSSNDAAAAEFPKLDLYRWQRQALAAWKARDCRGVVEAVTGTGKTWVGIAAAQEAVCAGHRVLVIVPTKELMIQWRKEMRKYLPGSRVGALGDGERDSLDSSNVVVAIVNSARRDRRRTDPRGPGLLIADECHRYGSPKNAGALDERFAARLGLSATYAREDEGNAEFLDPYFGAGCVYRMTYEQAIAEEVTAHFKVALVGVEFGDPAEAEEYDEASGKASTARAWLVNNEWAAGEPFGEFMLDVAVLAKGEGVPPRRTGRGDRGRAIWKARAFMSGFTRQRTLLAETTSKIDALDGLSEAFRAADRSIVFTMTKEAAEDAAAHLEKLGLTAGFIHSGQKRDARQSVLNQFSVGGLKVIAAARVLDEGIDVPEADLGVILSTSKTRRQMVQRMGRVVRRKPDGRLARFAVVYVEGTAEDPDRGAHLGFIEELTEVAEAVDQFGWNDSGWDDVVTFLNDFRVPKGQPPALKH